MVLKYREGDVSKTIATREELTSDYYTKSDIDNLIKGLMTPPDYSKRYGIGYGFTAPCRGYGQVVYTGRRSAGKWYVNGVGLGYSYNDNDWNGHGAMFPVDAGDRITWDGATEAYFVPCKYQS